MKIAIFGGSFNPIHNAHIKLALRFFDELNLDLVYFVVTHETPLKNNSDIISSMHRFNTCQIALDGFERFKVSDIEIKREGVSYSSDTIAYFKTIYPESELYFIMGADMFVTLEKWHNYRFIFDNVTLLTAPRDDYSYKMLCDVLKKYEKYNCKAHISTDYIEDLSSTMIRDMIKDNKDVNDYIDANVQEYINQNMLYR